MSVHDPHLIPWSNLVLPQLLNFTVFIGLLVFLLKKPLTNHFAGKNEEFEQQQKKAEEARALAERQNLEIKAQLKTLEDNSSRDLEAAHKEAKDIQKKILAEANTLAMKLEAETERMEAFELERAKAKLRFELVQRSTKVAEDELKNDASTERRDELNKAFINSMKAALR